MDAGFDTEGEESEEYGGVGGGSGERVVTADGSVTSSVGVDLEKSSVNIKE
jgi:hypothetical protein